MVEQLRVEQDAMNQKLNQQKETFLLEEEHKEQIIAKQLKLEREVMAQSLKQQKETCKLEVEQKYEQFIASNNLLERKCCLLNQEVNLLKEEMEEKNAMIAKLTIDAWTKDNEVQKEVYKRR